jgi:thiol-disulfide isomerase/thioredoxin
MAAHWRVPAGLHAAAARLPAEGELPSLAGATGWLNSRPLGPADLRGKVVLADFWTYTCINWLRTLPYLQAWAAKYASQGLVLIGVHTPEFPFEHNPDNVRSAIRDLGIGYPVATDNDYAVWRAFDNHYWPALFAAGPDGTIRYHHFGEEAYTRTEMVIQQLLAEAGATISRSELVSADVDAGGLAAAADWDTLASPELYLGYERTENLVSPGGPVPGAAHRYTAPSRLLLNEWALSGDWTLAGQAATLNTAGGQITCRFHARDVNLVLGPAQPGASLPFRVSLDGQPPGTAQGIDVDAAGAGLVRQQRLYQLIRQHGPITDRIVEITFPDPGVQGYVFTFG